MAADKLRKPSMLTLILLSPKVPHLGLLIDAIPASPILCLSSVRCFRKTQIYRGEF